MLSLSSADSFVDFFPVFQGYHQSVKQLGSRSNLVSNCLIKLSAVDTSSQRVTWICPKYNVSSTLCMLGNF